MDLKSKFNQVMSQTVNMALATSVEDHPNVRVVTFAYSSEKIGQIFFATFPGNAKIIEFEKNSRVCCTPLPENSELQIQVRIFGRVQKSSVALQEFSSLIVEKFPPYQEIIETAGHMLQVYEIVFDKAYVTKGMSEAEELIF